MTADEVFAAFGGKDQVQAITRAKRNAVNNWRNDGIPFRHWPALIQEADRLRIAGITFESLQSTRGRASETEAA